MQPRPQQKVNLHNKRVLSTMNAQAYNRKSEHNKLNADPDRTATCTPNQSDDWGEEIPILSGR